MAEEDKLYIGELSTGSIMPEDIERLRQKLLSVGYELVEVETGEPGTYDIYWLGW